MVEMLEVSKILNTATRDSLIILDEVGRGTATFDGMSIARAVAEYISRHIGARTMFATHYHELTQMADEFPNIRNVNCQVIEEGHNIRFLHQIAGGPASKNYGIQMARLAGLPPEIIQRAHEIHDMILSQKGALNLS
jgi:DNA mismatch repair protein MutS